MSNDDKMLTFIVFMVISIFCFSFGIGKIFIVGIGWIVAGCGYGSLIIFIFIYNKYLEKGKI